MPTQDIDVEVEIEDEKDSHKSWKRKGKGSGGFESDIWKIDSDTNDNCEYHSHQKVENRAVKIHSNVINKVQALCLLHEDTEFLVYLLGPVDKKTGEVVDNRFAVDVYIPEQTVSIGSVDMEEDENIPTNVIGALHKHPSNGKQNFSHTDDCSLNINHDISIVIPSNCVLDDWGGIVRSRQPCGCETTDDAVLRFLLMTEDVKDGSENRIKEKKWGHSGYGEHYGHGMYDAM